MNCAHPFLKWAGGKRQLLPELLPRVPKTFGTYFEPFLGGGALFWALSPAKAFLSDLNEELMNTYKIVRDRPHELVELANSITTDLTDPASSDTLFYSWRGLDREDGWDELGELIKAARFIYINKTGFNGLWRVNSKGQCNVPYGKYYETHGKHPTICDYDNILKCSSMLKQAALDCNSFNETTEPESSDFVYFDPPYIPINPTSSFTNYTPGGFGLVEHEKLRDYCRYLSDNGVKWMLSNSHCPLTFDLYRDFNVEVVEAKRAINSDGNKRGNIKEVIVRNYE